MEMVSQEQYDKEKRIEAANQSFKEKEAELQEKLESPETGGVPKLGTQPDHVNLRDERENALLSHEGLSVREVKDGTNPAGLKVHNEITEYLKKKYNELEGENDSYSPHVRSQIAFYINQQEQHLASLRDRG